MTGFYNISYIITSPKDVNPIMDFGVDYLRVPFNVFYFSVYAYL